MDGQTETKKCWCVTNERDSHMRAFGFKLLMGFLPTLARQRAWYPTVYDRPELSSCAKCGHSEETQEHLFECADHQAVKQQFQANFSRLEPRVVAQAAMVRLEPWSQMGQLQGRILPQWRARIPAILRSLEPPRVAQAALERAQNRNQTGRLQDHVHPQRRARITQPQQTQAGPISISAAAAAVTQRLLRASLETAYQAIWLPRCQRTIEQERSQGLHQSAKIRRMRAARHSSHTTSSAASPTPSPPPSFPGPIEERKLRYHAFMSSLMGGAP